LKTPGDKAARGHARYRQYRPNRCLPVRKVIVRLM
jgi:hypothetical protein